LSSPFLNGRVGINPTLPLYSRSLTNCYYKSYCYFCNYLSYLKMSKSYWNSYTNSEEKLLLQELLLLLQLLELLEELL